MGSNQSLPFDFYNRFAFPIACVDSIETETPSQVFNKLKEDCLTSRVQMEAVSMIIIGKAIPKPHLSQKCAQLVKELQCEACSDENEPVLFHNVFIEYFMNFMKSYEVANGDSKGTGIAVQRGKRIAAFIGNLYLADVFNLTPIIEICHIVKQKKTPKSKFFIETILKVISNKMKSENISHAVFNQMVTNGLVPVSNDNNFDEEDQAMTKFSQYMDKLSQSEYFEYFKNFRDFKNMSEKALEVEITILFNDSIQPQYEPLTNVYRDIALDIHYMRPKETRNCLSKLFIRNIERFEVIKDVDSPINAALCNVLGKTLSEFFQSGLLDERVVEHFLNAVKSPNVPQLIFINTFTYVLTKYRGKNIYDYLEHFKISAKMRPNLERSIAAVEDYVTDKEVEVWKDGKKIKRVGMSCADLPDFREYSSKCSASASKIFKCETRQSCHFASLRGIELLKRHIEHKFFTPERINACVKVTQKSLKFQIGDDIGDIFKDEMKTYLPYFHGDNEPTIKVSNFSNLLGSFYEEKLINHAVVDNWFSKIFESVKDKEHKFQDKIFEIYTKLFEKVSLQFLRDNPEAWKMNLSILDEFELKICNFEDSNEIFKFLTNYSADPNTERLQGIKIPNNKLAIKLISNFILKLHTDHIADALDILALIVSLPDEFEPSLDKFVLRLKFQDTLCVNLGHLCACCKTVKNEFYKKAEHMIDLIEFLCKQTITTRQGLANILNKIADLLNPNLYPVFELIKYFTEKISQFFIGANPLPNKIERILMEVVDKIKMAFESENINNLRIKKVINVYEYILEDSRSKRKQADERKQNQSQKVQEKQNMSSIKDLRDSSSSPPASETFEVEVNLAPSSSNSLNNPSNPNEPSSSMSSSEKVQKATNKPQTNNEPSTSIFSVRENPAAQDEPKDQQSTSTQPKMSPEDIKDYQDYCNYFDSIENKSSDDDKFFFDPNLISTIKITNKEQITDLAKKFTERVLAGQSTVIFFIQIVQKIQNTPFENLKNQKVSFQKFLIGEIILKFENQELLVQFMCELYNSSFVNKASMITFVDKFKSLSPENLVLMHTFVRTCAIRLSSQGDKEQLNQIRTIARSVKNLTNYDEDLKYLAQDLANSTNSLIQLLENGQNKPQVLTESPEKLIDDLLKNVLKNPQIYVKSASKLDGNLKDLLIQKIKNFIKEVPKFVIKPDEFINLIEFVAELYNLDFLKNEVLTWTIEILMQSSTNEICSQSIELLFTKCGQKMENLMKPKLEYQMKFFEAVLAEESSSARSECFRRIQKLRNRKWKTLNVPNNFYEDFLMLFSMNDAKVEELVDILSCDEEEMDKFILVLWKIILKDPPHPSYSILCEEVSKICENFYPKLTHFLTTRCITFIGFSADMFNENVKERLGKVMTFVAEIYNNNLASDEVLEMYLDQKLTSKLPSEFVTRIFSILSKCGRLVDTQNDRLKTLVKNFDDIYYQGRSAQIESIMKGLSSIYKDVNQVADE